MKNKPWKVVGIVSVVVIAIVGMVAIFWDNVIDVYDKISDR